MINDAAVEKYETEVVKPALSGKRGSAVALPKGGYVYVREPSNDEYMLLQSQSDAPHDAFVPALGKYIEACMIGACDGEGNALSILDVKRLAGAGYFLGPVGKAVNRLAGSREVPTRDL